MSSSTRSTGRAGAARSSASAPELGGDDRVAARREHRLQQPDVLRQVVDDEDRAGLAHVRRLRPAPPAGGDLAGKLAHVERLLEVAVEAGREEALAVVLHREGRERDDRDAGGRGVGPQPASASTPSMPGSWTSISTRPGRSARASASPSSAVPASSVR